MIEANNYFSSPNLNSGSQVHLPSLSPPRAERQSTKMLSPMMVCESPMPIKCKSPISKSMMKIRPDINLNCQSVRKEATKELNMLHKS